MHIHCCKASYNHRFRLLFRSQIHIFPLLIALLIVGLSLLLSTYQNNKHHLLKDLNARHRHLTIHYVLFWQEARESEGEEHF